MEEEKIEITEKHLDAIYMYIEMNFEEMTEEEKNIWLTILQKIDPNFYAD